MLCLKSDRRIKKTSLLSLLFLNTQALLSPFSGGIYYLTFATEACLLKAGPDALDSPCMLWVAVCVSTGTLVFQHQGVIYKACSKGYKIACN